jgi:serine/threonine protein kinase
LAAWEADIPAALAGHPRYRILEVLGEGGMGVVYKAVHRLMDRVVALKVPHRRFLDHPGFTERFRREARAAARLVHPHIVLAHDAEQAGDVPFLVMEYVPGTSLDRLVAQHGPLAVGAACDGIRQAALGLQHAHEHGMIHRDVKPANLLRTPAAQIKVLDFGLAQLAREETSSAATATPPGALVGTPDYTAPEQARDHRSADARADVYSLGCTLYLLLIGRPPFPRGTALEKLLAHQDRTPPPLVQLRSDVPAALAHVVARMLAKDPADRPQSAAEVARLLAPFADASESPTPEEEYPLALPVRERPRWMVPLLAAVLLLTVAMMGVAGLLLLLRARQVTPSTSTAVEASPAAPVEAPPAEPVEAFPLATPEQVVALKKERRKEVLAWVRDNNIWDANAPIVRNTMRNIDQDFDKTECFQVFLGANVLHSGRPTLLAAHPGGFFVFPLTAEQAREVDLKDTTVGVHRCLRAIDSCRATPRVRLSKLSLDHVEELDVEGEITGSIVYQVEGPAVSSPFAVRLILYHGGRCYTLLAWFQDRELAGQGRLPFHYPPHPGLLEPPKGLAKPRKGPAVLFANVASKWKGDTVVESNTAAVLAELVPPRR